MTGVVCISGMTTLGCHAPLMRLQSPEAEIAEVEEPPREDGVTLVRDVAVPTGMNYLQIQGVGLITGLPNTGSDPDPSPARTNLVGEMQSHDVRHPEEVLSLPSTALVVVTGYLPPGVQKGDRFDIDIQSPPNTKTTSLRSGYLMPTRLREMRVLDNTVHSGHVAALSAGDVIVDAVFTEDEKSIHHKRGRILGGGQSMMDRPLGLALRPNFASTFRAARMGAAINQRFNRYEHQTKKGVATPKQDNLVEIRVHPRYKNNISRYMRVIRSIAIDESQGDQLQRLGLLERKMLDPTTAARAALELEAIGEPAVPVLLRVLGDPDPEVRFYAAEALAYLDIREAAAALAVAARSEPAFRWHALTALSAMDHVDAYDALVDLTHVDSVETRYGAFRALRKRNPNDPLIKGEFMETKFFYHVIATVGPPMVHISRSRQPEIVLFGHETTIEPPAFLYAGKNILLRGLKTGEIRVTRYSAGMDAEAVVCSNRLDDVIRTIVAQGGEYSDLLQFIHEARDKGYLDCKVVVDALANPNRTYYRDGEDSESDIRVANPLPDLFYDRLNRDSEKPRSSRRDEIRPEEDASEENPGFFKRMTGWLPTP